MRIVALNLNDLKEDAIKFINKRGWKSLDHYFLGGWHANPKPLEGKYDDFNDVPYAILADKKGIVTFAGNPMNVDVEDIIDRVIRADEIDEMKVREQFKKYSAILAKKMPAFLNKEEFTKTKFDLVVDWKKETKYDEKGYIVGFKYWKPHMYLGYHINDEPVIKKIETFIHVLVGNKDVISFFRHVENPKLFYKQNLEVLAPNLIAHKLTEAGLKFTKEYKFNWEEDSFKIIKNKSFSHNNIIDYKKRKNVAFFDKKIKTALKINFHLHCSLKPGDNFVKIETTDIFTGKNVEVLHEVNNVLLIYFWQFHDELCYPYMSTILKISEANQDKWKEKVKIIAISCDISKTNVRHKVVEKGYKQVPHLLLGSKHKALASYGITVPFVVLVNQKGKIVYNGHPEQANLEENINALLGDKPIELIQNKNPVESIEPLTLDQHQYLRKLLRSPKIPQIFKDVEKSLGYNLYLGINCEKIINFDNEIKEKETKYTAEICFKIRKIDLPKLNPIFDILYEKLSPKQMKVSSILLETVNLTFGLECFSCKKELKPFDPQYYCYFCKLWCCESCGKKDDVSKLGSERLIHPHNMVYINIIDDKGLNNIDVHKFGKNLTFNTNIQDYSFVKCVGCKEDVGGGYRFLCLNCKPGPLTGQGYIDVCSNCIKCLRHQDIGYNYGEVRSNLENINHNVESHVFLRICYGNHYNNY